MKEAAGEANMTVITIVLIGVVAAVGAVFIPRLLSSAMYRSCCTGAGGIWENNYCRAITPTSCDARESMWKEYDQCVIDNGKHDANQKYRAVSCS